MILQEQNARTASTNLQPSSVESFVVGCPVCGRPAKVHKELIGEKVACGHCHGNFVVTEQVDGSKATRSTTAAQSSKDQSMASCTLPPVPAAERNELLHPHPYDQCELQSLPPFVVRPRHEAYALLASDLLAAGYRVIRAQPPTDTQATARPTSAGNQTALQRLFLNVEDFEFFTDSFAYQRRFSAKPLAKSRPRISWSD